MPRKVQTHHDDRDAGDDRELPRPRLDERADGARARAEGDEHGREAGDEQQRREHRLALDLPLGLGIGETLERSAGEIDEIGRHQRQHAGRQEAQQPGEERGGEGDVGTHGAP